MELLAGSLDVELGTFLHAGYLSAYPRSFERTGNSRFLNQTKVIDVKKALKLKDSGNQTVAAAGVSLQGQPLVPGSMISEGFTLTIVFLFFAWIISFYYRRERKLAKPGWRPWVLALAPLLLFGFVFEYAIPHYHAYRANRLPSPWQGVPVKEYEDPAAATHAILQGLVVNAMAGAPPEATSLAAVQEEAAFPVTAEEYTPGMVYAQRTYGRDGWGRDFAFEARDDGDCRIASAGPDGIHGTNDDIVVVTMGKGMDWEYRVSGVFVRPVTENPENFVCFVHRVDDSHFRTAHAGEARKLTGNDLFDMFPLDDLLRRFSGPAPVLARLNEHRKQQRGSDPAPLYFVQFTDRR